MVEYELTSEGFYIVTHESQEVDTTVPVGRKSFRTKNADGSFTLKNITAFKTFVDDSNYLQQIELIDNSGEPTPSISCRNAMTYVTIYEDYTNIQHPERAHIAIEEEKWHIFLFDGIDTWNKLIPDTQTISYETITDGYILKRVLTHGNSVFTASYKIMNIGLVEQGIKIENNSGQDIDIRFALTLIIPYPTIIKDDAHPTIIEDDDDEITPTDTEEELTETVGSFRVKVGDVIKLWIDVSRIKEHIWKWTHQRIDVDKIKIGVVTNGFTIPTMDNLEYWF